MDAKKTLGQYMTPDYIAVKILDAVELSGYNLLHSKIMEPSFGTGNILIRLIVRIVAQGKASGLSDDAIIKVLQSNIHGIEKDEALAAKAKERLNVQLGMFGLPSQSWDNLVVGDTLLLWEKYRDTFDYVIGNPPYVRIHNLPESERELVKGLSFQKGMCDLYVAFYKIGLDMLNKTGRLCYITPNSFMRNSSQRAFRKYVIENRYISAIYNFRGIDVFGGAGTYPCICVLDKGIGSEYIKYFEYHGNGGVSHNAYSPDDFPGGAPWTMGGSADDEILRGRKNLKKIGDIATVHQGFATNCDSVYAVRCFEDEALSVPCFDKRAVEFLWFRDIRGNTVKIESGAVKACVKASKYKGERENEYIIYPYDGKNPLCEEELRARYPLAYEYLLSYKERLSARDMDSNAAWFLYARRQGFGGIDKKKLVFRQTIKRDSEKVDVYVVDEDVAVYSGFYTTAEDDGVLEYIRASLSSPDFARYCSIAGKDMSGNYVAVSGKILKEYRIDTEKGNKDNE